MRLFAERAHAAAPGFELTSENAEAVAEICRRLDGLPLAIELAAARVRLLPPQALLGLLDDRMSLLTGGARDLPERQRTLRNTLDWSFGLLSPAGQALFSRLGVFPGTFDLEAARGGILREGLSVASDAGDDSTVGYYLQRLAALARQRDDPGRAVRLLAAADALLQAAGTGWLLAYAATGPSDDDALPGLRSRMGDATFQQAWAQGAAMGRQHAVQYALQD